MLRNSTSKGGYRQRKNHKVPLMMMTATVAFAAATTTSGLGSGLGSGLRSGLGKSPRRSDGRTN